METRMHTIPALIASLGDFFNRMNIKKVTKIISCGFIRILLVASLFLRS